MKDLENLDELHLRLIETLFDVVEPSDFHDLDAMAFLHEIGFATFTPYPSDFLQHSIPHGYYSLDRKALEELRKKVQS